MSFPSAVWVEVAACWPLWPLACTSQELLDAVASRTLNVDVSVHGMQKILNSEPHPDRLARLIQKGRARFPAEAYPLFDHGLHEQACRLQLCLQTLVRRAPCPREVRIQQVLTLALHCPPIHTLNLSVGKLGVYLKSEIERGLIDWHPAVWPLNGCVWNVRRDISEYVPSLVESWMSHWMNDGGEGHELCLRSLCFFFLCVIPDKAFPGVMPVLRAMHDDAENETGEPEQSGEAQLPKLRALHDEEERRRPEIETGRLDERE